MSEIDIAPVVAQETAVQKTAEKWADSHARREEQKRINAALQDVNSGYVMPQNVTLAQLLEHFVYITDGSMVAELTAGYAGFLKLSDFRNNTAPSKQLVKDEKTEKESMVPVASLWMKSPERKTVTTRTFAAGRDVICADPNFRKAVNLWRPIQRRPVKQTVLNGLIKPFLSQVKYLFADEAEPFLDWLAHIEQKPGELPHYGWLHIADHTGTGRNWLASVFARVWRGYVAPNVDLPELLESSFNGQLAGKVLAMSDEVQEGGNASYRIINKMKSLVNAETRFVNPKYGTQYTEWNSVRWLVFSNHLNAIPINDTDRRWRVVHHEAAPQAPEVYEGLYGLLNMPEFINALGFWLSQRDISGFKPGERPPMTAAKMKVLSAVKTDVQMMAEQIRDHWPSDLISNRDAALVLSSGEGDGKHISSLNAHMRRTLSEIGAIPSPKAVKVGGKMQRFQILRNADRWLNEHTRVTAEELDRTFDSANLNPDPLRFLQK